MKYDAFAVLQESMKFSVNETATLESAVGTPISGRPDDADSDSSSRLNGGSEISCFGTDGDGWYGVSGGVDENSSTIDGKDGGSVIGQISDVCFPVGNKTVKPWRSSTARLQKKQKQDRFSGISL